MYLSKENFTCAKEQMMHKELSLALTLLIIPCTLFKNGVKPDINSIENTVVPDQLASEEAS